MKKITLIIGFLLSVNVLAMSAPQAFSSFYNSNLLSSNKCGVNIQHFVKYLYSNKISFKSAYVVSIHQDFAQLNHFDSRWGSKEFYQNNELYYRSNWYFHVFLVVDGYAYDFSQSGPKILPLRQYLRLAYLPKYKTQNVFFQGVMTSRTELIKYQNLKFSLYQASPYGKNMSGAFYEGEFIEMFNL